MDLTGVGAVADLAKSVVDRIWPDKTEEERMQIASAMAVVQGQLDANKAEAANPSLFVSGWRPAVGWVCVLAFAWNMIGLSVAKVVLGLINHPLQINPADLSEMMPILIGMLGLGGLRTVEKINGVAAK
jgi:hypothetical protein